MIDPNHPFYEPLWRRLLIPVVCAVWAVFELYAGEPIWAIIVGAMGIYATYKLFMEKRKPPVSKPADEQKE
ncbi:DUF3329 domain-containing protein [Neorhizobium sp. CSC1952]|uniref:DUF3329 domain-containing protein n=1 Tax=Xaviernesmea oryzae TaxID=464029 RepID=A0A1X7GW44_9HYPH|nr:MULTISPECIES: hypothetical protein [Rhizobium/Agrobacterium group]WJR65865.1 DUF3329 domain-containing protein [Rhizobium sp. CSC1952]SMF75711.1 hypothetical protein SAMN02982989_4493 [Xaviernesmea oryzae]